MTLYRCETCTNKDDCDEYESQAVRDVSIRCGLICHSDFQSERDCPVCGGTGMQEVCNYPYQENKYESNEWTATTLFNGGE